jgi:hypothetical protein
MYLSLKRADREGVFALAVIIGPNRATAKGLPDHRLGVVPIDSEVFEYIFLI